MDKVCYFVDRYYSDQSLFEHPLVYVNPDTEKELRLYSFNVLNYGCSIEALLNVHSGIHISLSDVNRIIEDFLNETKNG